MERAYLPYRSAREHKDRGMAKWMGFFLSEHTTSLKDERKRVDQTSMLTMDVAIAIVCREAASQYYGAVSDDAPNAHWRSE